MIRAAFTLTPIGALVTAIGLVVAALAFFFTQTETGKQIWSGFMNFLKGLWEGLVSFFRTIFTNIGNFVSGIFNGILAGIRALASIVGGVVGSIFGFFSTTFNNIINFFRGVMNTMIGFAEGFVNFFIDGLNFIISRINTIRLDIPPLLRGVFGGQSSIGFNLPRVARISLPRLAEGGTVRATPGGMLAQIAEAGRDERVEPLDSSGLSVRDRAMIELLSKNESAGMEGNISINVYPSQGMNERELASKISRVLALQLRRGSVT